MEIEELKKELMQASEGLLMQSETDAPFEFYYHEKPESEPFTEDTIVEWDGKPGGAKVEIVAVEEFLKNMTHPDSDAAQEQHENAERFRLLQVKLKELLQDVKVFKISQVSMPVYLIGKTENGDYAGLKTLVVET
ncbi:nuclease A inhibitor family protein [Pontibacter oryzae]|uniref:Sugar-non-specific nuclease inhibitor NuiA-like protein n=1 Tax=Pontibacter oryzae TaxID=2304593 RepID=A0A399SHY0_9BACT|nr:nuclease A inhibitor family protein [Pontibacter oryzae]RIJ41702.1 sugar-non-specific nuclease inhibitor NuiA-like protein [Pontibacter oryzae]